MEHSPFNRKNFDYDCKPLVNSRVESGGKNLLSAFEVLDLYNVEEGSGPFTPGPLDRVFKTSGFDSQDVTEGHDKCSNRLAEQGHYLGDNPEQDPAIRAMANPKNYKWFDEPPNKNASAIIAELIETALPLEGPIQFERTKDVSGSTSTGMLVVTTDVNELGESVEAQVYLTVQHQGVYSQLHRDVVSYEVEPEDFKDTWVSSVPEWDSGPELWTPSVVDWVGTEYCLA